MPFHAGLDWGDVSHALCVIDGVGQVIVRLDVRHDAAGLADMVARLKRVAAPAELPIAIERPSGLVVDCRGRVSRDPDPSERRQGLQAALPRRRGQKRSRRCLHVGRHLAHRRTSLSASCAGLR